VTMHSPTPWDVESRCNDGVDYYLILDANGNVIADTLNSEAAVIHEDFDDEGGLRRWDEQGRVDMTLMAASPDLYSLAKYAATCRKDNTKEWMRGLVEMLNKVCRAMKDTDRFWYCNGDIAKVEPVDEAKP
jgi:hypothetical protein